MLNNLNAKLHQQTLNHQNIPSESFVRKMILCFLICILLIVCSFVVKLEQVEAVVNVNYPPSPTILITLNPL